MLHLERDPEGQWTSGVVAKGISGDPAAATGPGGIHAFAPSEGGGLLHAWGCGKEWEVEHLVETRGGISAEAAPASGLVAWGSEEELRVMGRATGGLVHWVWRADADWVAGGIAERAGVTAEHEPREDPLLVSDWAGSFHLFGTDGSGTVVHLEAVPWRAPGQQPAAYAPAAAPAKAAAPSRKQKARPRPVPRVAIERLPEEEPPPPLPLLDDEPVAEPVEEDGAGVTDLPFLLEDEPAPWETSATTPAAPEPEAPELEEAEPEWESTTADPRPTAESVAPELEPLDLENLASWMNPAPASRERPEAGPSSEPPPAWPDLD